MQSVAGHSTELRPFVEKSDASMATAVLQFVLQNLMSMGVQCYPLMKVEYFLSQRQRQMWTGMDFARCCASVLKYIDRKSSRYGLHHQRYSLPVTDHI